MRLRDLSTRVRLGGSSVLLLLVVFGLFAPTSGAASDGARTLEIARSSTQAAVASAEYVPVTVVDKRAYLAAEGRLCVAGTVRNDYAYPLTFGQVYVTTYDACGVAGGSFH